MAAAFDLFNLLVENMFGSVFVAIIAVIALIVIIGAMMRMSLISITSIVAFYLLLMIIPLYGGVVAVFIFFGCSLYFIASLIPWTSSLLSR